MNPPPFPPGAPKPPPRPQAPNEPPSSNGGSRVLEIDSPPARRNPTTNAGAPNSVAAVFGWNGAAKPAAPPLQQQSPAPPQQQPSSAAYPPQQQPTAPASPWGSPRTSTTGQQQDSGIVQNAGPVQQPSGGIQLPAGSFQQASGGMQQQQSSGNGVVVQPAFASAAPTAPPTASSSAPALPKPVNESMPASMVESSGPSAPAASPQPGNGLQGQHQPLPQAFGGSSTQPSFATATSNAPPAAPPPVAPMVASPPVPSSEYPAQQQQQQQHYVSATSAPAPVASAASVPPVTSLPPTAGELPTGGANHSETSAAREPGPGSGVSMAAGTQQTAVGAPEASVPAESVAMTTQQQTTPSPSAASHPGWAQSTPNNVAREPLSGSPEPFVSTAAPTGQLKPPPPEVQSRPMEAARAAPSYEDGSNHNAPQTQQTSVQPPQLMQTDRPSYDQHMTSSNNESGGGFHNMQGQTLPQQSAMQHDAHLGHQQHAMSQQQQQQARGPLQQSPHGPPPHHAHNGQPPEHSPQQQQQPGPHEAATYGNAMEQVPSQHPQQQQQPPPGGMRELRVEDALLYLDDVKREFKDRPAIYNEFLAIMKNFKSQEVDTPGVIARVSKLFRGYNNLILGFNTFLPDGYKISLADLERAEAQRMAEEQAMRESQDEKDKPKGPVQRTPKAAGPSSNFQQSPIQGTAMSPHSSISGSMQQGQWGQGQQSPHGMPPPNQQGISPAAQLGQPRSPFGPNQGMQQQQAGPPQHQAVEFDHAISYVTTIKRRFANDPSTYHSFLEILHTYQKEQRGIKEVLEQVAHLFQDHPDLLKEFTFFLPDAVQEQAKERLHRAAAESESRIAAQRQQQIEQYHQRMGKGGAHQAGQHFIDMTRSQMGLADSDARGRKRLVDGQQLPAQHQPEAYVYNSAVERQFFDSAREALTSYSRDGGQAWAEFLKCLDMYAQEILSRSEMLNFVEPLLGKRNNNLFEEFKRMLIAAGSPTHSTQLMEDSWYSVPLSEIDFSRCRRCSPSYRALPRDYPAHPCSDRSEEEAAVLNDIWVSLPVGSEESYTFRHMRRNTYEETLFRVEDERFEIDMVIDSNGATLQRLETIAEEIALLAQEDVVPADLGIKPLVEGAGLGGKRFQYTFDKNILGVIHRNTIARIYGDAGQEMLDLLVKNPTVAVPLVVQRLRQKDAEWRKVRDRLNRQWKELSEHNYYKSLDNRSLTWRTTDKRAISTRTLIAEIKDRALNEGREGKEAMRQKLEKAKEEHGTFYEVTVGEKLTQTLDLTFLPKPDRRLFTPHLSLMYKNVSWAQRDAYRILAFALERGPISPADKERCHRLWVEFLGPWFDLSLNWMQKPAVWYQESTSTKPGAVRTAEASVVSEEDEDSMDEDHEPMGNVVTEELQETDSKDKEFTDHHPLPAGAHVSTLYGEGKILEFRREDHIYAVQLAFGATGYLRPATVLCSMLPVEKSAYTRQLRADDRSKLARPYDHLAFGTQSLYLFFRLHHILVNRLNTAKRLAYSVGDDKTLQSMVEQMPNVNPKAVGRRRYEAYLSLVYALLDGGVGGAAEGGKYEDRVRSLLGHGAYELATMDKLISHIWKDIQTMANDETMWNLVQLYRRHLLAGSFQPEAFRQEAAYLSDGEPMYAFQHCPLSSNDESVLHIEYLGVMDDEDEDAIEEEVIEPVEQPNPNKRPKR